MVSENSMKGIDSPPSTKSNEVLNVNDIIFTTTLDTQSISSTNKNNKTYKYIFIVFCLILILLAAAGVFSIISYLVDENIKNCVNENIFNKKSTFINTCMSAIK
jgi:ABC-type antimicrobial peptide transport system permease subunit